MGAAIGRDNFATWRTCTHPLSQLPSSPFLFWGPEMVNIDTLGTPGHQHFGSQVPKLRHVLWQGLRRWQGVLYKLDICYQIIDYLLECGEKVLHPKRN